MKPSALFLVLTLLATPAVSLAAPAPVTRQPVDVAAHYSGQWLEIARRPMLITRNCVAATTDYTPRADGGVDVLDACYRDGKRVEIAGKGEILDPGTQARLKVTYNPFVVWEYQVLHRDPSGAWFISSDPKFRNLFIFARQRPTAAEQKIMVEKAAALGYDVSQLEFPALDR